MGLIKAGLGAVGGTLADQWKEFFYCDALDNDVLMVKGKKKTGGRSSNTKGSDNIISNGSVIAVADGQCMIIVEQGKIVEMCAEPGEFVFDSSTEPSIFTGSLDDGTLEQTFETVKKRFTFGGDTGKDQRVYYFNTKEIMDNKFGTRNPVPFRVVDSRINFDMDVSIRCAGVYSYKIANPLLFYTNVCGNVEDEYLKEELDGTLKTEFVSALQPAFAKLSALELRPSQIIAHNTELEQAMNEALTAKWGELRGIQVVSVALASVTLPEEDSEMLKNAQKMAQQAQFLSNPAMAAGTMVGAQADAMKAAAGNSAGAMAGFMGLGMAQQAGGVNAESLFAMGAMGQQAAQAQPVNPPVNPAAAPQEVKKAPQDGWTCTCGAVSGGKFCPECGSPKPADEGWVCACGAVNKGKFCPECGSKKPAGVPQYACDKCGWQPEDPANPPKFCPECGDVFDDSDKK